LVEGRRNNGCKYREKRSLVFFTFCISLLTIVNWMWCLHTKTSLLTCANAGALENGNVQILWCGSLEGWNN